MCSSANHTGHVAEEVGANSALASVETGHVAEEAGANSALASVETAAQEHGGDAETRVHSPATGTGTQPEDGAKGTLNGTLKGTLHSLEGQLAWLATACTRLAGLTIRSWSGGHAAEGTCQSPRPGASLSVAAFRCLDTLVIEASPQLHTYIQPGVLKTLPLLQTLRVTKLTLTSKARSNGHGGSSGGGGGVGSKECAQGVGVDRTREILPLLRQITLRGLLEGVASLTSLGVTSCGLASEDMDALRPLTKLRHLDLRDNKVVSLGRALVGMVDLQELLLNRNTLRSLRGELDGAHVAELRVLTLTSNEVKDDLDATLGCATGLRQLDLCGCAKHNTLKSFPGARPTYHT